MSGSRTRHTDAPRLMSAAGGTLVLAYPNPIAYLRCRLQALATFELKIASRQHPPYFLPFFHFQVLFIVSHDSHMHPL